ncbi:MAG: diguanylate cyclase [Synechococcaceae cyanobacterium SM2_3_1]|nr:diguanylate cyclase [Synechococcaceae cyanobacterium SM2_3_1]
MHVNDVTVPNQNFSVLVVDDEKTIRLLLKRLIQQEGYMCIEADDGHQCLAHCQDRRPDLILLDAMMPQMDGFQCCSELQRIYGQSCPPILMITALDDDASINRAFAAGAIDYITKPIHLTVFRHRVRRLLQMSWAMRQLQRLSIIDELTQLANRRHFDHYLEQFWDQKDSAHEKNLSLILCDIDHFKRINDTYGHPVGDLYLREIASIIYQSLKKTTDLAARYGGEEFALVLPDTTLEESLIIAEEIRHQVKTVRVQHLDQAIDCEVSLSLGVAFSPISGTSISEFITKADQALYQAKKAGRDTIVVSK